MLGGMKFTLIPRAQVAELLESAPPPAGGLPAKYIVTLTAEEREQLQALTQAGRILELNGLGVVTREVVDAVRVRVPQGTGFRTAAIEGVERI